MSRFYRTRKGNFYTTFDDGRPATVFQGKFGGWSFFLDGEFAGEWFDDADDAKAAARALAEALAEPVRPCVPECFAFFGLRPPVLRDDLLERYRRAARATHPDCGGSCEAFRIVQSNFGAAIELVGDVA